MSKIKISPATKQVIILGIVILLFRILYVDLYSGLQVRYGFSMPDYVGRLFSDHITLIALFCLNTFFVFRLARRVKLRSRPVKRIILIFIYVICVSILLTLLVNRGYIGKITLTDLPSLRGEFAFSFLAVVLVNSLFVVVVDIVLFMTRSKAALASEKDRRHKAQYQYIQLKQQLNPHFLFNSLNILDYLVQNGDNQRASEYIRKLAGVYRYLLRQEEEPIVELRDELQFVDKYVDLLKARFETGLIVAVDVPDNAKSRGIVPCGLQILVENAVKHNIVNAEKPLRITISADDKSIVVRNNLQLKHGEKDSTGVGLTNLEGQYEDIADSSIEIEQTENEFIVKLPLL